MDSSTFTTVEQVSLLGGAIGAFVLAALMLRLLHFVKGLGTTMATDLTSLTASVAANKSAVDSAVLLLEGLSAELKAAGTDPAALAGLQSALDASTNALAAAVTANTPAAPPAPPAAAPSTGTAP